MVDAITIKALQDASLDAKSLEDVINGDEAKQVTTRKGETYPSVKKAIKTMFENGGLPATPFATKALMTASALVDGQYAQVTDDTVNNGLYVKTAGAWVKSEYDPTQLANSYMDLEISRRAFDESKIERITANNNSKKSLDEFFGDYDDGFLIDPSQESDIQVLTVKNGERSYQSIESFFDGSLGSYPKVVLGKSGQYEWSGHNLLVETDKLDTGYYSKINGITVLPSAPSYSGDNSAFYIRASRIGLSYIARTSIPVVRERFVCFSVVFKPLDEKTRCFIAIPVDGVDTYAVFDVRQNSISKGSGVINSGIIDLNNGYYRLYMSIMTDRNVYLRFGLTDNNTTLSETPNLSAIIELPQANYGGTPCEITPNPTDYAKILPAFDYTGGERGLRIETSSTALNKWSDDITNAIWDKSGITALLTQISPLGTPCTRITATSNGGTALQTLSQNAILGSAVIRLVSGSGRVSLTLDGGATWQDVSSELEKDVYKRVVIGGNGNRLGFKLESSGDVIDICLVNASASEGIISPIPCYDVASINHLDKSKNIPVSSEVTAYAKAYVGKQVTSKSRAQPLRFDGQVGDQGHFFTPVGSAGKSNYVVVYKSIAARVETTAKAGNWEVVEITSRVSPAKNLIEAGINGEYTRTLTEFRDAPTLSSVSLAFAGAYSLLKTQVVNECIPEYDVTNWRYSGTQYNEALVNTCTITKDRQFEGSTMMREPCLFVLHDNGDEVDMLVTHMNRFEDGYHQEAPARLLQRKVRYNKKKNDFTYLTPTEVLYEPDNWKEGKGHSQSPAVTRIISGSNAGRLVCVFTRSDGEELSPRNIYRMFNDMDGKSGFWTKPEKIIDSATVLGTSVCVNNPDGSVVVLPPNHDIAPSRIVTCAYNSGFFASIYSDDDGITWQVSDKVLNTLSSDTINEPSICLLPDGRLLVNIRTATKGIRANFVSLDGGVNWEQLSNTSDFEGATVAGSLVHLSPVDLNQPKTGGDNLAIVCSGDTSTDLRKGLFAYVLDEDMTTVSSKHEIINSEKYVGYSSSKPILNGEYIAVAYEGGSYIGQSFNRENTTYLSIVKL